MYAAMPPALSPSGSNILVLKLDEFIRRFYRNQLIRGSIYATGILLGALLAVVLLEYFGQFSSLIRGVLFFGFLSSAAFVLVRYIAIPLLKLNRIGSVISYEQAASIIGSHFSNVQDKLLNVLQLQSHRAINGSDELLLAGINQKINELQPVPFATAIDLRENRRYAIYVMPLVILCGLIAVVAPHIYKKGATRLMNYSTFYEKEMPFNFELQNGRLEALQASDFRLRVKVTGETLPNEVFIVVNGIEYRLEKDDRNAFHYNFSNLQSSTEFQLGAAGFLTRPYTLRVLPRPTLLKFSIQLVFPSYLKRDPESLQNTGDLQVPQGTKVTWIFNTRNTDNLKLSFLDSAAHPSRTADQQFKFSRKFLRDNRYTVHPTSVVVRSGTDSVSYGIQVIADQHPAITVTGQPDSLDPRQVYFSGQIKDDYGFTTLSFHYKKYSSDTSGKPVERAGTLPVAFQKNHIAQPFFHYFNVAALDDEGDSPLQPGDKIEYYFEVRDNDGVNGPKATRTQLMTFKAPSRDEISANAEKNNSAIKKDLEESILKARKLQKDISDLARKINDKKQPGYEEKKKLEDLLKDQKALEQKIDQMKRQNEANNLQQNEFTPTDESILEKQKQLEQLFDNVMTPEMKKLFDELNKMLDKLDKNQVMEKLDEMKLNNKDIEKELDRNLEAFRQLEVQQKMQETIDRLDELKKKQDELASETEKKKDDATKKDSENSELSKKEKEKAENKELDKKQQKLSEEFNALKENMKQIEEKNKALEEPNQLPDTEKTQEEIGKEMQNSSQQLNQNNRKNAAVSQKNASQKMQEMRDQLEQSMMEEEEKEAGENAQALRQILENLLHLSFSQEQLMKELTKTRIDNPKYVEIPKTQKKLKDDSKIIEDSLFALSKRVPQISALVNREISAINMNMEKTVKALAERNSGDGSMRMQATMGSVNQLALMLNESLEEMQNQMKKQMQSKGQKGNCKKPGKGSGNNPSSQGKPAANLRKLQEQLNRQLQEMKEAMEKGQKPGDKPGDKKGEKPGMSGSKGQSGQSLVPGNSEQYAKLAAQQEALRRQMQQLMDKLKNKGKNPGGDAVELMEQTEKDLVNKQLTNETMRRQQDILSKLLESEKAEREREEDEQRKSNEAKNGILSNPEQFLEYKRLKEREMELLNTVPPSFTPYYKEKVNNYFNNLKSR
jgi:hypothetical protein